jgi:hypothetical protein
MAVVLANPKPEAPDTSLQTESQGSR